MPLLSGAAIRVTAQGKRGILNKLEQSLDYMIKRNYISQVKSKEAVNLNPFEREYSLTAPPALLLSLQQSFKQSQVAHA